MKNLTYYQINAVRNIVKHGFTDGGTLLPVALLTNLIRLNILQEAEGNTYKFTPSGEKIIHAELLVIRTIRGYLNDIEAMERRKQFIATRVNTIAFETDCDIYKMGKFGFTLNRGDVEPTMVNHLKALAVSLHNEFIEQTNKLIASLSVSRLDITEPE